ncbi:RNA polymerase sigma factor [Catenuloplanes sp. NPDC051500]|uniref:RNA polymerase sigma factor n=1 Tax=Catenuloplanes sp. NPDC051500 TaxID=3363959 RepID=UPI0037BBB754
MTDGVEGLLRDLSPQVLAALVRRYRDLPACEDALQEALLAAALQWPAEGMPASPRGWLVTVASRRVVDLIRSERARRDREAADAAEALRPAAVPGPGEERLGDRDDTLELLFLCCHPALTPVSQVALTLRAVGGLTTAEVAGAFLVPEATMGVRISRAKQRIRAAGVVADLPFADRLDAVRHVLYLIFNEGYTASSGPLLQRPDLASEAIRLARTLHRTLPDDGEVAGLLALMLLTDARRAARADADGGLIPLPEQDRSRWDHDLIREGTTLVTDAMSHAPLGPYQLQAAIASLHVTAPDVAATDWPQIRLLYRVLCRIAPSPMASLNQAIAVAMTDGPDAGLAMLAGLAQDARLTGHHRLASTRAHLRELAGDPTGAQQDYLLAAALTTSLPERHYLRGRAARLTSAG